MYIIIAILIQPIFSTNWAVLVAGSSGFYNYRHQSDVCHAYKTLIKNQLNPENIIVMAYDDIAYHQSNRFKGGIYNIPTWDGFPDNVYDGCKIDYKYTDVTPNNFQNILLGNADLVPDGFPVLNTNSEDNIFIYFSDHGAPGLIAFPFTYLYEEELLDIFSQMQERNLYNKIVFYLETCESGSMFINLPNDWNIYAVSAANSEESSYGIYCPPQDLVNGYRIGTCLGDEFSVSFLEHLDQGDQNTTLQQQFEIIKQRTKGSHVLQWGDLSFVENQLYQFFWGNKVQNENQKLEPPFQKFEDEFTLWNSRDVKLLYLQNLYAITQSSSVKVEMLKEQNQRMFFDNIFLEIRNQYNLSGNFLHSEKQNCLKNMIQTFENHCIALSDYGLKYVKYFNELCSSDNNQIQILEEINLKCQKYIIDYFYS